jgi:hypothetical protein
MTTPPPPPSPPSTSEEGGPVVPLVLQDTATECATDISSEPAQDTCLAQAVTTEGGVLQYEHPATLQELFRSVHAPITDAKLICQAMRPFVQTAIGHGGDTTTLRQILQFIDDGTAGKEGWGCTNGEMNAVVHVLNGNEYLLQEHSPTGDGGGGGCALQHKPPSPLAIDARDEAFMRELADLADLTI